MTDQHGQSGARMTRWARKSVCVVSWIGVLSMTLPGCASGPPAPDWQVNARGALERAVAAYFDGNVRVEGAEFARARAEVGRTGQAALVARAELVRCASRVASLVVEACDAFEALRQDAPVPERAYADYLAGRFVGPTSETGPGGADPALLPPQHRAAATASADAAGAALAAMDDPLARMVAAGVMWRTGRASPAVQAQAVDTASAQGWRRPLLAWLHVQARRAEQGGATDEAARLRRRIAWVAGPAWLQGGPEPLPPSSPAPASVPTREVPRR